MKVSLLLYCCDACASQSFACLPSIVTGARAVVYFLDWHCGRLIKSNNLAYITSNTLTAANIGIYADLITRAYLAVNPYMIKRSE